MAEDFLCFYEEILAYAQKLRGCHVIVVGLIPDPERDHIDDFKKVWKQSSEALQQLCKRFGTAATFFNSAKLFVNETGIDEGFYDVSYRTGRPDIHLNIAGAIVLAMGLKTHLQQLSPKLFYPD